MITTEQEQRNVVTAANLINENVATIGPDWTVRRVTDLLLEENKAALPVVDESGRLVGLVTELVILLAAIDPQHGSDPISLYMERKFVDASPSDNVDQLTEKFLLHRVGQIPVTQNGRFLGMITRRALMQTIFGSHSQPMA